MRRCKSHIMSVCVCISACKGACACVCSFFLLFITGDDQNTADVVERVWELCVHVPLSVCPCEDDERKYILSRAHHTSNRTIKRTALSFPSTNHMAVTLHHWGGRVLSFECSIQ